MNPLQHEDDEFLFKDKKVEVLKLYDEMKVLEFKEEEIDMKINAFQ